MKNKVEPEHKQYCDVKFSRVCHRPEHLVKCGMEPTYVFDGEAKEVWYDAEKKQFIYGDMWLCDLSEVVYWTPAKAPVVGLAYK